MLVCRINITTGLSMLPSPTAPTGDLQNTAEKGVSILSITQKTRTCIAAPSLIAEN